MIAYLVGAALVILASVIAWWRRTPAPDTREPAREREAARDVAADEKRAEGVNAIEDRSEREKSLTDIELSDAVFDTSKGRKTPLLLVLAFLWPSPASASECKVVDDGVLCTAARYHEIVTGGAALRDERDLCALNLATANEKLDAAREHVAALVAIPTPVAPSPWPERAVWTAIVVVLVTVAVAR